MNGTVKINVKIKRMIHRTDERGYKDQLHRHYTADGGPCHPPSDGRPRRNPSHPSSPSLLHAHFIERDNLVLSVI